MSSSVCLHCWQINKQLLGNCLPIVQRAWLKDRNAGVLYWGGGQHQSKAPCERRLNMDPRSPNALCVMKSYKFQMWVRSDFGPFSHDWLRFLQKRYGLGLSLALLERKGMGVFMTTHRGAASHHGKGWHREHEAHSTGDFRIVVPLSVESQIGRGLEELTLSWAMSHSHHVHGQYLIFHVAGEEPAWIHC